MLVGSVCHYQLHIGALRTLHELSPCRKSPLPFELNRRRVRTSVQRKLPEDIFFGKLLKIQDYLLIDPSGEDGHEVDNSNWRRKICRYGLQGKLGE